MCCYLRVNTSLNNVYDFWNNIGLIIFNKLKTAETKEEMNIKIKHKIQNKEHQEG